MEIWHCWTPRIVLYFHLLLDHKFSPKEFTLETSQWSCFWMEHLIGQRVTSTSRVLGALSTALRQMKIVALLLTRSLLIHYKVAYICKVTVVLLHFISYLLHPITETLREHPQRAILETCDLWDICSEWLEDMTWQKNWQIQIQRQWQRQIHFERTFLTYPIQETRHLWGI